MTSFSSCMKMGKLREVVQEITANFVTTLNLHGKWIGDSEAKYIAAALKRNQSITTLILDCNGIGDKGVQFIAEALMSNESITSIYLNLNKMGSAAAGCLAEALKINQSIIVLNLDGNMLQSDGIFYIAKGLRENKAITTLNLDCNEIGSDGACYLKDAFKFNNSITSIYLNQNKLGRTGANYLASALELNHSIALLSLDCNEIGNEGVGHLSKALKNNQSLTFLSLACNGIGDDGAKNLAEALAINKAITNLNVDCNEISYDGAEYLAESLKVNQTISTLSLQCNEIEDAGALFFAEALKITTCITSFYLNQNGITYVGAKSIVEALKVNKFIITLNLNGNKIGDVAEIELAGALQINRECAKNGRQGVTTRPVVKAKEQIQEDFTIQEEEEDRFFDVDSSEDTMEPCLGNRVDETVHNVPDVKEQDVVDEDNQHEKDDEATIKKISDLIRDGNDRLRDNSKRGILLLGNTGAGKSTLAHLLSGKKLQAIMNEDTGQLVIDALEPHKDIIIGHAASETRIPNKCVYEDITIWDCPGYYDTDHVREIANTFYIKRLFETTDEMKFVLVVPELVLNSAITRGSIFINTLSNFIKSFNNIETIMASISLVVTHVAPSQTVHHIKKLIDKIMANHPNATDEHTLINKLKDNGSMHLFYKPSGEGELAVPNLLAPIEKYSNYCVVEGNMVNIAISDKAMHFSLPLLRKTITNFNDLLKVIVKAICNATQWSYVEKAFSENYGLVQEWLPSSIQFKDLQDHFKDQYFPELDLLLKLQKELNIDTEVNIADAIIIYQKAVDILAEYAGFKKSDMQYKIQGYSYCLQQQYEYGKFFASVCKEELVMTLEDDLKKCFAKIREDLERQVTGLPIDENQSDLGYYHKAIEYLGIFPDSDVCLKHKAIAYGCMANIAGQNNDQKSLIVYCTKAIRANSHLPKVYDTLGLCFYNKGEYAKAIDCFKVINNEFKIKACFKAWYKQSANNPDVMLLQAECFESIGLFEQAKKYYHHAFSLSQDDDFKAAALKNIGKIMANTAAYGKDFITRANEQKLYNFSLVNEEFIRKLLV